MSGKEFTSHLRKMNEYPRTRLSIIIKLFHSNKVQFNVHINLQGARFHVHKYLRTLKTHGETGNLLFHN